MIRLALILSLKDEPVKYGELSSQYMQRVQRRAADVRFWLGWLPGIREQIFTWTNAQKLNFDKLNGVYDFMLSERVNPN